MREFVRPAVAALSIACLSGSLAVLSSSDVSAQAKQTAPAQAAPAPAPEAAVKQMALTEKQIEGVLTAAKDMDAITAKLPEDAKPDPKITAQLDDVAKKNGFASYDEYNDVVDNISMVLAGFDPTTKKYVGTEAVIKAQIAQVQADKKMNAKDKNTCLTTKTMFGAKYFNNVNAQFLQAVNQVCFTNDGSLVGKYRYPLSLEVRKIFFGLLCTGFNGSAFLCCAFCCGTGN